MSYFRVSYTLCGAGQVPVAVSSADVGDAASAAGRRGAACNTRSHQFTHSRVTVRAAMLLQAPRTCHGVGGGGAGGGAGRADHAGVAAAGSAHAARAGAAVAAPLPALPGAAGPLPGAVLSDVVTHLETPHGSTGVTLYRLWESRLWQLQ